MLLFLHVSVEKLGTWWTVEIRHGTAVAGKAMIPQREEGRRRAALLP
jgi:hypothetical protein